MKDAYTKMPEQVLSDLHSDGSSGLTKNRQSSPVKSMVPIPLSVRAMNLYLKRSGMFHRAYASDADLYVITLGVNIARYMTGGEYNFWNVPVFSQLLRCL